MKEIWMIWTSLHNFDHDRTKINDHNLKIEFDNKGGNAKGVKPGKP